MKRCTKCKEEKDEADFYNDKKAKDGKTHACKRCMDAVSIRNQRAKRPPKKDWSADPGFKICRKCLAKKPKGDFNLHHGKTQTKDKLRNECKECQATFSKEYYAKIAVEERKKRKVWYQNHKEQSHGYHLMRTFKIKREEYLERLKSQGGVCAICGLGRPNTNPKFKSFSVDHNHETGEIRGLLCNHCNAGLGNFFESPDFLQKAIDYLLSSFLLNL